MRDLQLEIGRRFRGPVFLSLRLLYVEPMARGLGIGSRLVAECIGFARRVGYDKITLWTNDMLVSARRIYQAAGFHPVREEPHHSFGRDLVGQYWELPVTGRAGERAAPLRRIDAPDTQP